MKESGEVVRTLELEKPIDYAGEKLALLQFREPTAELLDHIATGPGGAARPLDLVAYLTGLPGEVVRSLDVLDAFEASEIVGEMMIDLQKKVRTRKRARNKKNRS